MTAAAESLARRDYKNWGIQGPKYFPFSLMLVTAKGRGGRQRRRDGGRYTEDRKR